MSGNDRYIPGGARDGEPVVENLGDRALTTQTVDDLVSAHEQRCVPHWDAEDIPAKECVFGVSKKGAMKMKIKGNGFRAMLPPFALNTVARRLQVPGAFAERLVDEDPTLLAHIFNRSVIDDDTLWLIRATTNDKGIDTVRAVLKGNYACLDNADVLRRVSEALKGKFPHRAIKLPTHHGGDTISVGVVFDKPIGKGDNRYVPGISVTNSEIGQCQSRFQASVFRMICANGMMVPDNEHTETLRFSQYGIGRKMKIFEDYIRNLGENLTGVSLTYLKRLRSARKMKFRGIENPDSPALNRIVTAINRTSRSSTGGDIVTLWLARDDHSLHGLSQAISRYANEVPPATATRLRSTAASILEHPDVRRLARAA